MADHMEYVYAWIIYLVAGAGCCVVWWKLTTWIKHPGLRDLARGMAIVLIFTPWYVGDSPEFYAPAVVIMLMSLFLEGSMTGLRGGIVLLFATFLMLVVLTVRQLRRPR